MRADANSLLAWLRSLPSTVVRVTPRTVIEVQAIVERGIARDDEELATSLATLLAQDNASWQLVQTSFRAWRARVAAEEGGDREAPGPGTNEIDVLGNAAKQRGRRGPRRPTRARFSFRKWAATISSRRWVALLAVLVALAVAAPLVVSLVGSEPVATSIVWPTPPPTSKDVQDELPAVVWPLTPPQMIPSDDPMAEEVELPPPGPWWVRLMFALGSLLLAALAARWWQSIAMLRHDLDALHGVNEQRRRDLHRRGSSVAVPYEIEIPSPFPEEDIDGAASILARMSAEHPGWDLDIEPTIARMIDEGGQLRPVFLPVRQYGGLVILVDLEDGGHPDLHRVEALLERFTRSGLRFHRYDFHFRPTQVRVHGGGAVRDLAGLARVHPDAPLLILSRWAKPADRHLHLTWPPQLAPWTNRAWLDLDPRVHDEHDKEARTHRERIASSGLHRFPFTRKGLLACARTMAAGGHHGAPIVEPALPPMEELAPHLELWAACACLVPDPIWPQLHAIRRAIPELSEHLPDARHVHRLTEWLRHRARVDRLGDINLLGHGARLEVPAAQLDVLRERLRARDQSIEDPEERLEVKAWKVLQAQLLAAKTTDDPLGESLRNLKLGVIEAIIEPDKADALMKRWAGSAVAPELVAMLAPERRLQCDRGLRIVGAWRSAIWEQYEVLAGTVTKARLADLLKPRPRPWTRRRAAMLAAALGVVMVAYGGWWWSQPTTAERERAGLRIRVPASWEVRRADDADVVRLRRPCVDEIALAGVAPLEMKCIVGGMFTMGSPEDEEGRDSDEGPLHNAEVGSLWMGATEITQAQWKAVMGTEPFDCEYGCGPEYPAQNTSWNDAAEFMNRLTERENQSSPDEIPMTLCYKPEGDSWAWTDHACTGYRLPTETEWEYAARADTNTVYSFGDDPKDFCRYGNGADQSLKTGRPELAELFAEQGWSFLDCDDGSVDLAKVGGYKANPWGLFDMHGNAWEWVWDWYSSEYPSGLTAQGYDGPERGEMRVLRGGSFGYRPVNLRSALRYWYVPTYRNLNIGFRCVRVVPLDPSTP